MAHNRQGRGGTGTLAATNERKRRDAKLLEGLDALRVSSRKRETTEEVRQEAGLLNSLERLVMRARKEPQGVLQRLEGFLEAAKQGQIGRRSIVDRDGQETEKKEQPVPKRERESGRRRTRKSRRRPLETLNSKVMARRGDPRLYVCQAPNACICVSPCGSILGPFRVHFGSILGLFCLLSEW